MARYYDMDKLKALIEAKADTLTQGKELLYHIAGWLNLLPAAEVAPKSEVAREIFKEIEAVIRKHDERPAYNFMLDIEKLKTKYTEEK